MTETNRAAIAEARLALRSINTIAHDPALLEAPARRDIESLQHAAAEAKKALDAIANLDAIDDIDDIDANIAQLLAMLTMTYGNAAEPFGNLAGHLQDRYLEACRDKLAAISDSWEKLKIALIPIVPGDAMGLCGERECRSR